MAFRSLIFNRFILKYSFNRITSPLGISTNQFLWNRLKYTQNTGVKGIRGRKSHFEKNSTAINDEDYNEIQETSDDINLNDTEYDILANTAMHVTKTGQIDANILIIQPYIKWGPKKTPTNPDLQLQEAEALIRSLPRWTIEHSLKVPVESLEKKTLFGTGKLEELKNLVKEIKSKGKKISYMFISKGTLSYNQKTTLEAEFGIPILDRYSVVIQILRLHATSTEAKLQVAMAEIPYIWGQIKEANPSQSRRQGYALSDSQKELLRSREKKIKLELENIRSHRKLLRNKRKQQNYPIIAIVGYTNAGKTSLIKALTDEKTIQPKDQLFATLDVTAHAGYLPCNLKVIYMDTVGFMSDLPTGLIECFVATLEDAMLADIIVHVQDLSHENNIEQKRHVENTLKSLIQNENFHPEMIINVGNKVDLIPNSNSIENTEDLLLVSSKTLAGINDLMIEIEKKILQITNRTKITFRISNGGEEMAWLYKNAAIMNSKADPENEQNILISAVIANSKLQQFRHYFLKK